MLDGVWDGLRKKLGAQTRYPPPAVADPRAAIRLKNELEDFYVRSHDRFRRLFLRGKPLPAELHEKPWLELYRRAGLVKEKGLGIYVPCVRIFPLHGAMVATDLLTHREADQVFSLMLEQLYVVTQMKVRRGDRALELCVGSGVNSLFLSDVAGSVTAVDLSPRAVEFARFNALLNPGGVPVDLREGSLCDPLDPAERFDYVLVNPPFEPVPPGAEHFLHSHGGEDGLDLVREILAAVPGRLAPGGRFEMFTWSPGDGEGVLLADLLREAFPERRIEIHRVDDHSLEERTHRFRSEPGFAEWRKRLEARGFRRVWGVFVRVAEDGPPETTYVHLPDVIRANVEILHEWV